MTAFKKTAVIACGFFSFAVLVYTAALAVAMGENSAAGAYGLLFKNIAALFVYSWALGAAELIFSSRLPSAAKRVIHIFALYAATLACALVMASPGRDARQIVLFVFILTLLYTVIYTAASLVIRIIRKARE